ncbi:MAG: TVP38/TMEM64 family protein [Treponemataceae bacterium]|nr:TVP38/TMEM64 family protein [Treponemataceae bacterium]
MKRLKNFFNKETGEGPVAADMLKEETSAPEDNYSPSIRKKQRILCIAAILAAVILSVLIFIFVGLPLIRFISEPEKFRLWVEERGLGGKLAFVGVVILQVIIAIIPGEPFEIAAGYAFGAVEGTILCILAATLGSICVFLLVRRFGEKLVGVFFPKKKLNELRFLKSSPRRDFLFLIIFTVPGTPKDLLSYFVGLTDIRLPVWLLICSLGRIPSVITSTIGGNALGSKDYFFAVIVFVITIGVSGLGLLIYNWICRKRSRRDQA